MDKIYRVHLGKAKCGLDLGDGSERAEYVNQDYILHKLGRPHRCVNIMYTLYPKDAQWPQRISVACADMDVKFQWDYPYDDYPPYGVSGEPFEQMKDIRKHGQDVLLTLTVDCSLDDDALREVARQLAPFGRMRLRINHECAGDWFTHNKRFSHQEIADFFVRFCGIVKEEAPDIQTIFCAGMINEEGTEVAFEKDFLEAYRTADIWSADHYMALHYGWPYDVAEPGGGSYTCYKAIDCYQKFEQTAKRLREITGQDKPMTTAEFNVDGDVTGPFHQGEGVLRFAEYFQENNADWFDGISMYQFRDRGRLGLEIEDPNNKGIGIEQPLLANYRKILRMDYYMPPITKGEEISFPAQCRWGGSEDAEGIEIPVFLEKMPEFCEATFEEDLSLMVEFGGKWFYKAPGVRTIDFMSLFFEKAQEMEKTVVPMRIFLTPPDGTNPKTDREDWQRNYYGVMRKGPELRIRYEVPGRIDLG